MPQLRDLCLAPMLFTLTIWKRCVGKYSLSSPCPLLLNILFNPDIPDSLSYSRRLPWTQAGVFQRCHLVHPVTHIFLSFSDLQSKLQILKSLFYSYLQIKHFLSVRSPDLSLAKPTNFELLCTQGPYESHLISSIYKILYEAIALTDSSHSYISKWVCILQQTISLSDWGRIWESSSKVSRCMLQKETAYKIIMFWNRTPDI